jgi:hypothetical protein
MTPIGRVRALLLGAVLLSGVPAWAQRAPRLDVTPPGAADVGAVVTTTNLFAEPEMRDLVRAGFPASLRYRLELWRTGRLSDDLEGQLAWEFIIQYDPTAERYRVVRRQNGKLEDPASFATLATAQTLLERPTRTTLVPERAGSRYYYSLTLQIEALSVSDMDELERWLRGARSGTAASAVGGGLRTLILRMLGEEKRRYDARSVTFVAEK